MRYLYKINSAYDGFRPARIPERLHDGRFLTLGWAKYIDAIRLNDEVWVVFKGTGFPNGVYAKGLVASIDEENGTIQLRVRQHSTTVPLTDDPTSAAILAVINVRYRQVFLWPPEWAVPAPCGAQDCANRNCRQCAHWVDRPIIEASHYRAPKALRGVNVIPAYWSIPPRCYLYYGNRSPAPWIRRVADMFAAFKVGEARFAYPLAAGIAAALQARGEGPFDAIIPIPLSPDKAASGELDRTKVLAAELSQLAGAGVRNYLTLAGPISKRRMILQGYTPTQFKQRYRRLLQVDPKIVDFQRILLVDDAITRGSTLAVAAAAIQAVHPQAEIVVSSAVQMIVKEVVANENGPAW